MMTPTCDFTHVRLDLLLQFFAWFFVLFCNNVPVDARLDHAELFDGRLDHAELFRSRCDIHLLSLSPRNKSSQSGEGATNTRYDERDVIDDDGQTRTTKQTKREL